MFFIKQLKRFFHLMICWHFHLSENDKALIEKNRYVKCQKCDAEYLELKLKGYNKDG